MTLPRRKPTPLPEIHPLPEYAVEGEVKAWYEAMKTALQVPWMGVVTMAYAHYPTFFAELWRGLEPLATSRAFVAGADGLRRRAEAAVATLNPAHEAGRLGDAGYGAREIDQIAAAIAVFSHGNPLYLVIATLTRHLLEGGALAGQGTAEAFAGRHAPDVQVPFVLMEAHHADPPTRAIYADVKQTLGLPFVNTDYRAFARWPSYFALAWADLRAVAGTPDHEAIARDLHETVAALVADGLPNPGGLGAEALRAAAAADAPLDEVIAMARLFQWLLPGLITNVAYLRAQLTPEA